MVTGGTDENPTQAHVLAPRGPEGKIMRDRVEGAPIPCGDQRESERAVARGVVVTSLKAFQPGRVFAKAMTGRRKTEVQAERDRRECELLEVTVRMLRA